MTRAEQIESARRIARLNPEWTCEISSDGSVDLHNPRWGRRFPAGWVHLLAGCHLLRDHAEVTRRCVSTAHLPPSALSGSASTASGFRPEVHRE